MAPGADEGKTMEDRGAALLLVLIVLALLTALGVSLVLLGDTDVRIASTYEAGSVTFYAADAAIEWAAQDLQALPSGSDALSGVARSTFSDLTHQPILASGVRLDLDAITAQLQAQANSTVGIGPDTPVWRLFAWGPFANMVGEDPATTRTYVAAWIADDVSDADGNPSADQNGIVTIHAEAFGLVGTRRIIEATLAWRPLPGSYWLVGTEPTGTAGSGVTGVPSGAAKTVSLSTGPMGVMLLEWREVR